MVDEQHAARLRGELRELLGLGPASGERLLDEDVPAALERLAHPTVVGPGRRRDHHRFDRGIGDRLGGIYAEPHARIAATGRVEPRTIEVADPDDAAAVVVVEIADQVRAPVTRTDDGDADHARRSCRGRGSSAAQTSGRRIDHQSTIGRIFV